MERSQSNKYLKHTIFQENPYQRIQTGSSPLTLADPSLKNTLRLQNNGKPASFVPAGQSTQMIIGATGRVICSFYQQRRNYISSMT